MLPLLIRVDLEAMAMKRYSIFPKAQAFLEPHNLVMKGNTKCCKTQELEPHHLMQFSVIPWTLVFDAV